MQRHAGLLQLSSVIYYNMDEKYVLSMAIITKSVYCEALKIDTV